MNRFLLRAALGVAAALTLATGLASPSFGAKRQPFDVTDTVWQLDTKTRAIGVARGIATRRTRPIAGTASLTFEPGGTLSLSAEGQTFAGTWSQTGKTLDVTIEESFLELLDDQCDDLLNGKCTFTSLRVKANATVRRGNARLKFKLLTRTNVRFRGVNVRVTSTVKGKGLRSVG